MWFFRYTSFLEEQNRLLNAKIESLETRNHDLVMGILSKSTVYPQTEVVKPESKHQMKKGESRADCSCGWHYISDDPGKLQTAILSHYREIPANRGRKNWPQVKAALEGASEEN
jgi:hypothetical protein